MDANISSVQMHRSDEVDHALRLAQEGRTAAEVARLMAMPRSTIRDWLRGAAPDSPRRLAAQTPRAIPRGAPTRPNPFRRLPLHQHWHVLAASPLRVQQRFGRHLSDLLRSMRRYRGSLDHRTPYGLRVANERRRAARRVHRRQGV